MRLNPLTPEELRELEILLPRTKQLVEVSGLRHSFVRDRAHQGIQGAGGPRRERPRPASKVAAKSGATSTGTQNAEPATTSAPQHPLRARHAQRDSNPRHSVPKTEDD